jgi:hypothetical protein
MEKKSPEPEYLMDLVENRYRCTKVAAGLYKLLRDLPKNQEIAEASHTLVAISFSLWRSAFLTKKDRQTTDAARGFLAELLETNNIAFVQDRNHRDWTFNYYASNARLRLAYLFTEHWKDTKDWGVQLQAVERARAKHDLDTQERWNLLQSAFSDAVAHFELILKNSN